MLTAWSAFSVSVICNANVVYRWVRDKDVENVSMKSEDDMIDDLERVRQYKARIFLTTTI